MSLLCIWSKRLNGWGKKVVFQGDGGRASGFSAIISLTVMRGSFIFKGSASSKIHLTIFPHSNILVKSGNKSLTEKCTLCDVTNWWDICKWLVATHTFAVTPQGYRFPTPISVSKWVLYLYSKSGNTTTLTLLRTYLRNLVNFCFYCSKTCQCYPCANKEGILLK